MRPLARLLGAVLDGLLPRACAGCAAGVDAERVLCDACERSVRAIADTQELHGRLRPLDAVVTAAWLEPPVNGWLHAFKYPARGIAGLAPGPLAAMRELGRRAALRAPGPAPPLVVPVPLHPRRLRARGFNPALAVARAAAQAIGARVDPTALERVRDTPTQTGLAAAARRANLRGAMRARRALPACVWIADDVVTTGATASEAARALRAAGARRVVAVAAACTPLGR